MSICRDKRHKRAPSGAMRVSIRKKRKHELGRQPAMTKIGARRVHTVRVRGGNEKQRALRLDVGNFAWGSENATKKVRIIRVVYNPTNNELVRTNTLVKGCIVEIDATPFRQWYENRYAVALGRKANFKMHEGEEDPLTKARGKKVSHLMAKDQASGKLVVEKALEQQFSTGRILARLSSRPGQTGRADGVILEGDELHFYQRRLKSRK